MKAEDVGVAADGETYDWEAEVEGDDQNGFLRPGHLESPDELDWEDEEAELRDDVQGRDHLPADGLREG